MANASGPFARAGDSPQYLSELTRRWPDQQNGPFVMRLTFDKVKGRATCVGVELWGRTPPARPLLRCPSCDAAKDPMSCPSCGHAEPALDSIDLDAVTAVTATALRLPLQAIISEEAQHAQVVADFARRNRHRLKARTVRSADAARRAWEQGPRIGRPPMYGAEHWERVAGVYLEAARAPGRATPTSAVRDTFAVGKSTAAKWVAKCRGLGLIPPTTRGQISTQPEE